MELIFATSRGLPESGGCGDQDAILFWFNRRNIVLVMLAPMKKNEGISQSGACWNFRSLCLKAWIHWWVTAENGSVGGNVNVWHLQGAPEHDLILLMKRLLHWMPILVAVQKASDDMRGRTVVVIAHAVHHPRGDSCSDGARADC